MKILYVATVVKTHIMHFHLPMLQLFKDEGWETAVVARNDYDNPEDCRIPFCDEFFDLPFERNPFKVANIKVYRKLKRIIDEGQFDVISCHTPVGGFLARLASRKARKSGTKVIYTAHGFHFYKGASLLNWLIYYPVEKFCSGLTDVMITINEEDYNLARKKMNPGRVEYVPGVGIDIKRFSHTEVNREHKRREIGVPEDAFLLLSVGELIKNKNHKTVIRAVAELGCSDIHYVVAGSGKLLDELKSIAEELGIANQVHLMGYRRDANELYKSADVYVLPSFREGLNVSVMEAMAAGLPCIVSNIRGNVDLIDKTGGVLVNPSDVQDVCRAIGEMRKQYDLRKLGEYNSKKAEKFEVDGINQKLREIYTPV